ncbi:hypothetical protein Sjap_025226 [Stephania japonica]|uniref:Uncharacterized protein n=1 Tax=Stephania japonica TaxID=461633 RepID=A0AAP0E3Z3_9MAGN
MSRGEAPNWSDQWGSGGLYDADHREDRTAEAEAKGKGKGKRMAEVKATAAVGMEKAKTAAVAGAQKVKSGTAVGFKWVKEQYQKRSGAGAGSK